MRTLTPVPDKRFAIVSAAVLIAGFVLVIFRIFVALSSSAHMWQAALYW